MYRILLADDERVELQALRLLICRMLPELVIAGEAANGEEAVRLALELQPDMILMDVNMPRMNGLEAVRIIKTKLPDCHIIILSAYDQFSYVQNALRLDAEDYLLKPASGEELADILRKVMQKMGAERTKRAEEVRLKELLGKMEAHLRLDFMMELIANFKENHMELSLLHINQLPNVVMVFTVEGVPGRFGLLSMEEQAAFLEKINSLVQIILQKYTDGGLCITGRGNEFIILFHAESDPADKALQVGTAIRDQIQKQLALEVTIGYDWLTPAHKDLRSVYSGVINSLLWGAVDRNGIFSAADSNGDAPADEKNAAGQSREIERKMTACLKKGDLRQAQELVVSWWRHITPAKDFHSVLNKCLELIILLEQEFYENSAQIAQNISGKKEFLLQAAELWSPRDLLGLLNDLCNDIAASFTAAQNQQMRHQQMHHQRVIESVRTYIMNNFSRQLTLDDLAGYVKLSPAYLAFIFKEVTGFTVMDYLTRTRIDAAKKYLHQVDLNISEVAVKVGYDDPNYFSNVFRKIVGVPPSKYRACNE